MRIAIATACCLGLLACQPVPSKFHEVKSAISDQVLSPSVLNSRPEEFDGQRVMVRGYVRLGTNAHNLFESEALDAEFVRRLYSREEFEPRDYDKYCLTIANPGRLFRNASKFDRRTMVLSGKFIKDYRSESDIDLGACANRTALVID